MDPIKPINPSEKKILSDKEFLNAVKIGRPRKNHDEGTTQLQNKNILEYIEKNYKYTPLYENLRFIAHLHDAGKFAFLEHRQDTYLPVLSEEESQKLISES